MSTVARNRHADACSEIASGIRSDSGWIVALSVLQMIVGMLALNFSFSAILASVAFLGSILVVAAGPQTAALVVPRSWRGFIRSFPVDRHLVRRGQRLGTAHPVAAAEGLARMLAAAFLPVECFGSWSRLSTGFRRGMRTGHL